MKFTLSWLRDHLDTTKSVDEICTALNSIGLEVESVEDPSKTLGNFRIARILTASQHPNADRLQVCQVNAGEGFENVQVVCGAPNARLARITIIAIIQAAPIQSTILKLTCKMTTEKKAAARGSIVANILPLELPNNLTPIK